MLPFRLTTARFPMDLMQKDLDQGAAPPQLMRRAHQGQQPQGPSRLAQQKMNTAQLSTVLSYTRARALFVRYMLPCGGTSAPRK